MSKKIPFVIDHLDPLGQGVSKRVAASKQATITFIPKTLPGERGEALVLKSSKGVEFAQLSSLQQRSPQRIEPECEHYERCSGCDYLHVSYADEVAYKKSALLFLLRAFGITESELEIIAAPQRFAYRNRVQLHYRHKYIGLVDANSDQILEVPHCRLLREELRPAFEQLYRDKSWATLHKGEGKNKDGHCELSLSQSAAEGSPVVVEWDAPYASGGFTQVNEVMNGKLKTWLAQRFSSEKFSILLDLFAGEGNLSEALLTSSLVQRTLVDSFSIKNELSPPAPFIKLDLFAEDALPRFIHHSKLKQVDVLLLDPPRKGFAALWQWDKKLKPEYIVYVSCNPATLARDLQTLIQHNSKLKIQNVLLLDMFPSTRHFESVVVLRA